MDQNHLNNFEEDQPRIIPVKFVQNPISRLGEGVEDVVWRNFLRMETRTMDDGQNVTIKAHLVTMWQVS